MEYISVKAIAEKWNIGKRAVQLMCTQGKIKGAKRLSDSGVWLIPEDAKRPIDMRKSRKEEF